MRNVAISDSNGLVSELTSTNIDNLQGMIAFVNYFSHREGVIRKDPVDKPLKVAGFTCKNGYGFP